MLFEIGDKIVYPMHGAGVIKQIEEREVFGKIHKYYIIEMPIGDMCLMIPVDKTGDSASDRR